MLAIASVLAANYGFTKHVFFSRTGATFLEARLMEDDLIRPILEEDCPRVHYALCPYAERLPHRADAWLWSGKASPFGKLGGFRKREAEASQLVVESIARYPLTNLIVALENTAVQLFWFQTGDGIVPQEWLLNREFKWAIPQELKAYDHAWQQEGDLWFLPINIIHVPVAFLSLAGLFLFLRQTIQARQWRQAVLPAFVALALFGNAFVCATFSGAHGRYQSRIMWLPALTLALIGWPAAEAAFQRRFRLLAAATPRLATEIESVP